MTEKYECSKDHPDHPHGQSQKCRHHGCRCDNCRTAHNERARLRRRLIAYGRNTTVPAQPTRDHIAALRSRSMGIRAIEKQSGVPFATIGAIMWGRDGRKPPERIMRTTADAILAVEWSLDNLEPGAMIDATPYRRRLRALACLGWTWTAIAGQAGTTFQQVSAVVNGRRMVQAATARRIRDIYDELWNVFPVGGNAMQAAAIRRTRERAVANGWAPPLAWDDHDIDNPKARPKGLAA